MCYVCCKEFRGWCRAFTKTERLLTILEVIILLLFIVLLIFVILHLSVCPKTENDEFLISTTEGTYDNKTVDTISPVTYTTVRTKDQCTWKSSHKTAAGARYFDNITDQPHKKFTTTSSTEVSHRGMLSEVNRTNPFEEFMKHSSESEGEEAPAWERAVLALVRQGAGRGAALGCVLTAVTPRWALTAASCLRAVEEVDSLDAFVMVAGWGTGRGAGGVPVADVRVHGAADLAALRGTRVLSPPGTRTPRLPSPLLLRRLTPGERLTLLGFGPYRSADPGGGGGRLRAVEVRLVGGRQCASVADESWAPRHLVGGAGAARGGVDTGRLCAGPAHARGLPCQYCAGAPLLRGATLLAVMADNPQCGVACEPALYVPIDAHLHWIRDVITDTSIH